MPKKGAATGHADWLAAANDAGYATLAEMVAAIGILPAAAPPPAAEPLAAGQKAPKARRRDDGDVELEEGR